MVEHLLAKEGVAGSIPVSRSFIFILKRKPVDTDFLFFIMSLTNILNHLIQ